MEMASELQFQEGRGSSAGCRNQEDGQWPLSQESVDSHSANLERNVRWLANASCLHSAPSGLSAPQSNCRKTGRKSIFSGYSVGPIEPHSQLTPSTPIAPLASASRYTARGYRPPNPRGAFPPPAPGRFKPGPAEGVMCILCKKNGETPEFYTTHKLKDCWGRVICPILRAYTCPNCGVSGDNAHTVNYCPYN